MKTLKVVLALITRENDYQREQASVAEATAQRLGIGLRVLYANNDAILQTRQILETIHAPAEDRPDAVVVEPVGTGMLGVAGAAAGRGIGWVVLNREADYLSSLRQSSAVPIGSIECDNAEVGRIQGRQFAALLPSGGNVLYIEGPGTDVVKQRRAGVDETLPANVHLKPVPGRWTEESAFQIVAARLSRPGGSIDLIGCQNDAMAMGARKAVEALTDARQREHWLSLPFTGVDGVPATGQAWVREGLLAATVVAPALTGVALEMLAKAIGTGTPFPERTLLKPASFPAIGELRPRVPAAV
jgi:ABC-type sugar transport system substrate-binding protein